MCLEYNGEEKQQETARQGPGEDGWGLVGAWLRVYVKGGGHRSPKQNMLPPFSLPSSDFSLQNTCLGAQGCNDPAQGCWLG